jgi:hypothetical protein
MDRRDVAGHGKVECGQSDGRRSGHLAILVRRGTDLRLGAVQEVSWESACGDRQATAAVRTLPGHCSGSRVLDVAAPCKLRLGRTALLR